MKRSQWFWIGVVPLAAATACGDRPEAWDKGVGSPLVLGMQTSVAVIDDSAHRAVFLASRPGQQLDRRFLEVGHGVVHAEVSPDKSALFVLSTGDVPRKSDKDQRARLNVFKRAGGNVTGRRFDLASPLSGLAIDPLGRYVAAYAGGSSGASFVENPNEIVLVDLEATQAPGRENAPVSRTLRSFGGRPQRLTFTPILQLPGGPRRLLVVETEQDVSLLDLDHLKDTPERPEITVRLTNGSSSRALVPAAVVVDDGDPAKNDDARIGIRIGNDPNVITLTLAPVSPSAPPSPNDFTPKINLTDVGGIATDIAFVRTDGGLRLAALVPSRSTAVLVEPDTSVTTDVNLSEPFQKISLITSIVGSPGGGTDVAILYGAPGAASSGVAFWSLGKTSGQPYRSVEVLSIEGRVSRVLDVPDPHPELKVLESSGNAFYVLNLVSRTAAPGWTRATSRSGTSIWTLTGLMSCSIRIATEALLVAAAWELTAAPTSSCFWDTKPLKGATIRVSSTRIWAIRSADRCCSTWVCWFAPQASTRCGCCRRS